MKKAIVLLSGGLDSATTLYAAKKAGYKCLCLSFDYGQRHIKELRSAGQVAASAGCAHKTIRIKLPWDNSTLTGAVKSMRVNYSGRELPPTYVPGRNTVFISFALSYAESVNAQTIFIGANQVDFSGYPDCRAGYIAGWQKLINSLGVKIKILAPLINMSKGEIIRKGLKLGVPYKLTWSCYSGARRPCGKCDSCRFRALGFKEAGTSDPAIK